MKKLLAAAVFFLLISSLVYAQSGSGTVRGSVLDPSGAAVKGASVSIENPVSQYSRTAQTDPQGNFEFDNVPFNNYHVTAVSNGFQTTGQDINVRAAVPLELKINLKLG